MTPFISDAQVVAQDPDTYSVFVILLGPGGGQGPILPVQVLTHGPRDAVRGNFPELPVVGQTGLVAFTRGDPRNGRWLGSYSPNLIDASAMSPGIGNVEYRASYGGGWAIRNEDGSEAVWWPDGSYLLAGAATLPTPTRHTLDGNQARQRTPYTAAERVPAPPAPFPFIFAHQSGATAQVTAAGSVLLEAANGQTATVQANGATVVIDVSGNVSITSSGTVAATAPSIKLGDGGTLQALLTATAATVFNTHTHPDPQGGTTGTPNQTMGAADQTTIVTAQ